jgi:hypothetical protein
MTCRMGGKSTVTRRLASEYDVKMEGKYLDSSCIFVVFVLSHCFQKADNKPQPDNDTHAFHNHLF